MKLEKLGKISTVVGIVFLPVTFYNNFFSQDPARTRLSGVCCAAAFLAALVLGICSLKQGHKSEFYRWICYKLTDKRGVTLKSRELYYSYTDREHMEHWKKFQVINNTAGLESFTDRYVYSGGTDCILKATEDRQSIAEQYRDHGWNFYSIKLQSPAPKGKTVPMGMRMETIEDPQHKAKLFLSTGIYEPTENLKMEVHFGDGLVPHHPRLKIFRDYVDRFPLDEQELTYDPESHKITYELEYPVYHYKYLIEWMF